VIFLTHSAVKAFHLALPVLGVSKAVTTARDGLKWMGKLGAETDAREE
jgi:hypothetical protein